jgi:hypothetical protein
LHGDEAAMTANMVFIVEAGESSFVGVGVPLQAVDALLYGEVKAEADFVGIEWAGI